MLDTARRAFRGVAYIGRWVVANIIPLLLIAIVMWNAWATATHIALPAHPIHIPEYRRSMERIAVIESHIDDLSSGRSGDRWTMTTHMTPWADELHRRNPGLDVPDPGLYRKGR